jgi:hypothetical protein
MFKNISDERAVSFFKVEHIGSSMFFRVVGKSYQTTRRDIQENSTFHISQNDGNSLIFPSLALSVLGFIAYVRDRVFFCFVF